MELITYPDRELLAIGAADALGAALRKYLDRADRVTFCVPGGTTPGETFALLSGADLAWERVDILLGDERWVPEDHARSNTGLIRRSLMTGPAARANLVPMVSDADTPEDGIPALLPGVEAALPISLLVLGMGDDMHTASLFPGGDRLAEAMSGDAPPLVAMRAPEAGEPRLTLSRPVLADAMETHLLIQGAEKRARLDDAQRLDPLAAPIAAFLRSAIVHWAP